MTTHSICIVTYERPDFVLRCLTSLKENVTPDTEIVVVDASAAGTPAMVEAYFPSAAYVHAPQLAGWMTRSRNEGLRHVGGDIVSFIDDDVVISTTWQSALLSAFADPTVTAVAGRTRNLQPGEDSYDQPIGRLLADGSLTEGFASLPSGVTDVDHGIGANMSFRRSMLALLGGFRDDYPGTAMREDTDMFLRVKRAGGRAIFVPDAVVDHLPGPHIKGRRFDTRYKLYARRNHMVLLARDGGIGSPGLRRWIRREFRTVGEVRGLRRKVQRFGVTSIGVAWGAAAMARHARWGPTPPVREDDAGNELRALLSR